jgi:hypothetical protein
MTDRKIPFPLIGKTAEVIWQYYTHSDITNAFLMSDRPSDQIDGVNKTARIQKWLIDLNKKEDDALIFYGIFISDYMEDEDIGANHEGSRNNIKSLMSKHGLNYGLNGKIYKDGVVIPVNKLKEINHEFVQEQIIKENEKISKGDYDGAYQCSFFNRRNTKICYKRERCYFK